MRRAHSMPFGAEVLDASRTAFRLWAPSAREVQLCLEAHPPRLVPRGGDGIYETIAIAPAGTRYHWRIDGEIDVPDPASRYNPGDVHGDSAVIDPHAYEWRDDKWRGRPWDEAVIYELHVGAFSPEGTFAGVEQRLDHLADLGITAIELMPISDFPGRRNWGYDGVLPFAPDASYGTPDDLKRLIDAAHGRGLMVLLDVVYNHFGPEGNYLGRYAKPFFTERHHTPWGAAINYDGAMNRRVRDFFIHNALYWLEEFHFDGLRFDAVHAIVDDSRVHFLEELARALRDGPGQRRHIHLVLENDANQARYLQRIDGQPRYFDAQWNDDAHHALHILLTGERDGYYEDYAEQPIAYLGRCLTEGFGYQGEASQHRDGQPRGERSAHLPPEAFVTFLQNHDQIGNRAFGERLSMLLPEERLRAAVAVLLLAPSPPMLFMGEEFGAATPFLFFCDFSSELAALVTVGRRREFARFERFADAQAQARIPDPNANATFVCSKLDWPTISKSPHANWLVFYRELLAVRFTRVVPRLREGGRLTAAHRALGPAALAVRWNLSDGSTLALYTNLGDEAVQIPTVPLGALLFVTPQESAAQIARAQLPAWTTAWYHEPSA
jgi:malto-oligosyltrehalose trehalohydrolase